VPVPEGVGELRFHCTCSLSLLFQTKTTAEVVADFVLALLWRTAHGVSKAMVLLCATTLSQPAVFDALQSQHEQQVSNLSRRLQEAEAHVDLVQQQLAAAEVAAASASSAATNAASSASSEAAAARTEAEAARKELDTVKAEAEADKNK
jgi:hypothetical protein